jgi:glutamate synthase domain-containing protein 2
MRHVLLPFAPRYILLTLAFAGTAGIAVLAWRYPQAALYLALPFALFAFLAALGVRDLMQTKHAILRNYPIAAHIRFILEHIRPELRQYFFENEKDGMPFARDKRAIVYQRAKKALDTRPFGTHYDVYRDQFEWLHHSINPREPTGELFRIVIGPDCARPYSASVFNISALSFGSVSANAIRALNKGAKLGTRKLRA